MQLAASKTLFTDLMKKFFYLSFLLAFGLIFAQSKYTEADVEKSTDAQVIANFIKHNPTHPRVAEFKTKLYRIVVGDPVEAKPEVAAINSRKLAQSVKRDARKGKADGNTQKTVDLLNHLFSTNDRKEAYVQIENRSKCNLIIKISGKKFYNLDVPAKSHNFILIDKGTYKLSTMVCDSEYATTKTITKDIVIALNN